jgi:Fur family ferric uptake transcriptional regulator
MPNSRLEVERALNESGYRITRPRLAVIEVITRSRRPLSPEEVFERARKIDAEVGLATVYRTLDMLQSLGQLQRVRIGAKGYTVTCSEPELHFHLVCEKCRGVTELDADRQMRALAKQLSAAGFTRTSNAIEIVGVCVKCRPAK